MVSSDSWQGLKDTVVSASNRHDIREFPVFSGFDAIFATEHWDGMERCFMLTDTSHLDIKFNDFDQLFRIDSI